MNTGHYLCRNKYYGRGLSIDGFRQALYQYLHNGKALRQDLLEPILNKLRSLKTVLERQASYRFYSSSLLIIYEGQVSCSDVFCIHWSMCLDIKRGVDAQMRFVVPSVFKQSG